MLKSILTFKRQSPQFAVFGLHHEKSGLVGFVISLNIHRIHLQTPFLADAFPLLL